MATTPGTGIVNERAIDAAVVLGVLVGAIAWDASTWRWGMPSSSSHALVGGMVGAGLAKGGTAAVVWPGVIRTIAAIVLSRPVGSVLAMILGVIATRIVRRSSPFRTDRVFREPQLGSAAMYSLGHGGDEAQKTLGIIATLFAGSATGGTTIAARGQFGPENARHASGVTWSTIS